MTGTIVNVAAIFVGSILGLILKKGINEKLKKTVMDGLALCVILIGISGALKSSNTMLIIISIVIGGIIGELIDIDLKLKKLGDKLEEKLSKSGSKFSEGFVTATLLFCVGSMAIVGSIEAGLTGNYKTLFAKSILDGISSIIFSSALGIGVMFSGVAVLIYQGSITLMSGLLAGILDQAMTAEITAVGSLLILGLGLNMLNITKIKVANLLPAILIPLIYGIVQLI
ncbi:MAG: DUF554 domain-containing protein [Clostridiaceae bacterium]